MVVMSFDDVVAESESELKMYVEIAGESESGDPETPIKAVVYWINSHTGYFMAPSTRRLIFHIRSIFLLVDACVGLNWLLVSFLSHVNKNIIHSFIHSFVGYI